MKFGTVKITNIHTSIVWISPLFDEACKHSSGGKFWGNAVNCPSFCISVRLCAPPPLNNFRNQVTQNCYNIVKYYKERRLISYFQKCILLRFFEFKSVRREWTHCSATIFVLSVSVVAGCVFKPLRLSAGRICNAKLSTLQFWKVGVHVLRLHICWLLLFCELLRLLLLYEGTPS
jgi:hypothetical protein